MECPYCTHRASKVTNKRESPQGIRRRRECLKCKRRFTTYEKIEKNDLWVLKRDGRRERFMLEKLDAGIGRAFEKRPIPLEQIERIGQDIEEQIRRRGVSEVKSTVIGELVMKKIKKIDRVAYIRFASVYRNFKDVSDFKKELNEIGKEQ